ncbi:putative aldehyde dehydrogenase [Hyaloscypha finlandica]|nr:putative aldehyde dehydrogenase [Hyaloscypha finlandica]
MSPSTVTSDGHTASDTAGLRNGRSDFKHEPLTWTNFSNIIDGKLETTKESRCGINPATEQSNPSVPVASKYDVDKAMSAAQKAFKPWAAVPYAARQKAVLAFADGLEAEKEAFSKFLTQEQGKPIQFARLEIDTAVAWIRSTASFELPVERTDAGDKEIVVRYTPLGVAVGIVPWNFPILLAVGKIAAAVVTGNPIIIKPSPFTPAGGLKLALSGDDNLGIWLTAHPTPAKISFTGSTATGKKVMESASKTLKRVTLELGGKDPAIIFDDIDIDDVASKIATFAFLNSGQICLAIKRILVHEKIIDEFRNALVKYTKLLKVGEGNEEGVFLGPIQNSMQFERVKGFFADIEKEGMTVAVGGKNPSGKGYFITPTIIDRPAEDSRLVLEEPFGPIVPLLSFANDEEAINKANNTFYGLGASVWSKDIKRANNIAEKIEAGTVWVNCHFEMYPNIPFGGHKQSGIGVEQGLARLKSYCNSQTLYLRKSSL